MNFYAMEKNEFRAVIKYLQIKGLRANEVKAELDSVFGDLSPALSTVNKYLREFRLGRTTTEDLPRSGRPKTASTSENITAVYKMILENRQVSLREIAKALVISPERVHSIVHNSLMMKKLQAHWVPRTLTVDQKMNRVLACEEVLKKIKQLGGGFWSRFVTVDETWVHHYTAESKQASRSWTSRGEKPPTKVNKGFSAGKVMATIFWDQSGILLIDYLETGKAITGAYYVELLNRLREEISTKRPSLVDKKILFHQDNAPAHKSFLVMAKLDEYGFDVVNHPPYSPDLAPSDFFLFGNLKNHIAGRHFSTNEEVKVAVEAFFDSKDESFYEEGIKAYEDRLRKCIELHGEYTEE